MARAAPRFIAEQARALFEMLAPYGGIHLVYIHPKAPAIYGRHYERDVEEALAAAEKANVEGLNVYWTVNAVRRHCDKKPTKSDITHARFVHVDIDPPKTGGKFDKAEIAAALTDLSNPPSFVIDSGGGLNAYWRLDDPCENLASIEAINRQVRDYFSADACHNIDRVMRVPGTINYPNTTKQARGRAESQAAWVIEDDGVTYDPADLARSFPAATSEEPRAGASVTLPSNIEPATPDSLGLSALDPIRLAISEPPGRDRSGDGVAAARLMANAGMTDEQIFGVLLNSENAVSAHYLDQRDPRRAAARTIQLVRSDGPASGEPLYPTAPAMTAEDHRRLVLNMRAKAKKGMEPTVSEPTGGQGGEEPKWLRDLESGGLARFVRHVISTAPSPQPWVTLGAALAAYGALAGRRYCSPVGFRTNIYSIGICDSGGGKDHPLRSITRLMIQAERASSVGGSKIASGQAMITDVTKSPSLLYPLDEVGFLISSAADRRRAPKHIVDIIDNLTEFYSLSDSTFLGTSYANQDNTGDGKPRKVIEQPCLCLFGVTTPGVFWGSLSSSNVMDGSLARMLIFQSENDYPNPQHNIMRGPIPADIVEHAKAISAGADNHNPFPMGDAPMIAPKPYVVPYADLAAKTLAEEMRELQTKLLRTHRGTHLTSIYARLAENAAKIALIKAITDDPSDPKITCADLSWGMMVARHSVDTLAKAVFEQVADTEYEAQVKKVHRVIAEAGSGGIDGTSLSRKTQFVNRQARANIIAHLEESAMIRIEKSDSAGVGAKQRIYYDIA